MLRRIALGGSDCRGGCCSAEWFAAPPWRSYRWDRTMVGSWRTQHPCCGDGGVERSSQPEFVARASQKASRPQQQAPLHTLFSIATAPQRRRKRGKSELLEGAKRLHGSPRRIQEGQARTAVS